MMGDQIVKCTKCNEPYTIKLQKCSETEARKDKIKCTECGEVFALGDKNPKSVTESSEETK